MADILIRGIPKPTDCGKCFVGGRTMCADGCPIHELPEHGDLIDVSKISLQEYEQAAHDALHNGKGSILYDCGVLAGARAITQFVRRQPVIIPSSKEEAE